MAFLYRLVLFLVLGIVIAKALRLVIGGFLQGLSGPQPRRSSGPPAQGVRMVRDPVCGTFLPPANALALTDGEGAVRYFCSTACRDTFQAGRRSGRDAGFPTPGS